MGEWLANISKESVAHLRCEVQADYTKLGTLKTKPILAFNLLEPEFYI